MSLEQKRRALFSCQLKSQHQWALLSLWNIFSWSGHQEESCCSRSSLWQFSKLTLNVSGEAFKGAHVLLRGAEAPFSWNSNYGRYKAACRVDQLCLRLVSDTSAGAEDVWRRSSCTWKVEIWLLLALKLFYVHGQRMCECCCFSVRWRLRSSCVQSLFSCWQSVNPYKLQGDCLWHHHFILFLHVLKNEVATCLSRSKELGMQLSWVTQSKGIIFLITLTVGCLVSKNLLILEQTKQDIYY